MIFSSFFHVFCISLYVFWIFVDFRLLFPHPSRSGRNNSHLSFPHDIPAKQPGLRLALGLAAAANEACIYSNAGFSALFSISRASAPGLPGRRDAHADAAVGKWKRGASFTTRALTASHRDAQLAHFLRKHRVTTSFICTRRVFSLSCVEAT